MNIASQIEPHTARTFVIDQLQLKSGVIMRGVVISYRTRGRLALGGNAVLITHGYRSGRRMIGPTNTPGEGDGNLIVGLGKPVHTAADRKSVV